MHSTAGRIVRMLTVSSDILYNSKTPVFKEADAVVRLRMIRLILIRLGDIQCKYFVDQADIFKQFLSFFRLHLKYRPGVFMIFQVSL